MAHPMEFHVESTSIAHRFALGISAPQSGGCGVTVGTGQAKPPGRRLEKAQENKRTVVSDFYVYVNVSCPCHQQT